MLKEEDLIYCRHCKLVQKTHNKKTGVFQLSSVESVQEMKSLRFKITRHFKRCQLQEKTDQNEIEEKVEERQKSAMMKGYLVYHIIKQAQSYQSYEKLVLVLHTIGQYMGQKYNS